MVSNWCPESLSSGVNRPGLVGEIRFGPQQSFHICEMGTGHSSARRTWELAATACGSSGAHVAAFVPSATLCLLLTLELPLNLLFSSLAKSGRPREWGEGRKSGG